MYLEQEEEELVWTVVPPSGQGLVENPLEKQDTFTLNHLKSILFLMLEFTKQMRFNWLYSFKITWIHDEIMWGQTWKLFIDVLIDGLDRSTNIVVHFLFILFFWDHACQVCTQGEVIRWPFSFDISIKINK